MPYKVNMADAISIGELLIDFVPVTTGTDLTTATAFHKAAGGAPANVAVGLARLGIKSALMGKAGEDGFGRFLAHYQQATVSFQRMTALLGGAPPAGEEELEDEPLPVIGQDDDDEVAGGEGPLAARVAVAEDVARHARDYFTRGNAVLVCSGPPPESLRLPLPEGRRRTVEPGVPVLRRGRGHTTVRGNASCNDVVWAAPA